MLDAEQVSLRRGQNTNHHHLMLLLRRNTAVTAKLSAPYLGCGEQRHSELEQTLDLDLHGGQGPLEDG